MSILEKLILELTTDDVVQQVRELCSKIQDEEHTDMKYKDIAPKGPNIFLSLNVPGRNTKEVAFLTLEREAEQTFIIALLTLPKSSLDKDIPFKRRKVWEISPQYENKAPKILTEYAKQYKFLRGE